jgi:plasmid maintenance system antidote protein VapI
LPVASAESLLWGARHREGLIQAQLAVMIGVKSSHISDMEKGKRSIYKDMAKRLAKTLNTSYLVFL